MRDYKSTIIMIKHKNANKSKAMINIRVTNDSHQQHSCICVADAQTTTEHHSLYVVVLNKYVNGLFSISTREQL